MLLDFLYLALLSTALGLAFGLGTAYCLRTFSFHHVSQARARRGLWGCCSCRRRRAGLPGGQPRAMGCRRMPLLPCAHARLLLALAQDARHAVHWLTASRMRARLPLHPVQELALIGMTAYLSYLAGDVFGLSGILVLFVCAVAISHYALHNISGGWGSDACRGSALGQRRAARAGGPAATLPPTHPPALEGARPPSPDAPRAAAESRTTTIYAFHTLSYISEGVIFVYCGLDALDPLKWQVRSGWQLCAAGLHTCVQGVPSLATGYGAGMGKPAGTPLASLHPAAALLETPTCAAQNTDVREVAWMFWILLLLLVASRAAFVVPVTLLHNRYATEDQKLSMKEMATILWAGLMRGAVSGALHRRGVCARAGPGAVGAGGSALLAAPPCWHAVL